MYRHEGYLVGAAFFALDIGEQRHLLQEIIEGGLLAIARLMTFFHKLVHAVEEFLEVLTSRDTVGIIALAQILGYTTLFDDMLAQGVGILRREEGGKLPYEGGKLLEFG